MNLLSKPYQITFQLIGSYLSQLYMNPIRTKSITSCIIASLGNYVSQRMSGARLINHDTFWAFAIFGLLFGGSIPHYFYETVSSYLMENSRTPLLQLFLIERIFFMPAFSFFTLYMLSRFEGKDHNKSFDLASSKFLSVVEANLKFLSLMQYINVFFVPPMLRVLVSNLIGFFWIIYLSHKRQVKK